MATVFRRVANRAAGTLASSIDNVAVSVVLGAGQGSLFPSFPGNNYIVTCENERMLVTARSTDTLTVTRGHDGTSAASHSSGVAVELRVIALDMQDIHTAVNDLEDGTTIDHGTLQGLADDDHPQYMKEEASGGVASEVPDHTHATSAEAGATLSPATLNLPVATAPTQTAEGQAIWDSDNDLITVGDGAATKRFPHTGHAHGTGDDGAQVDHGGLGGLTDDDHTQYLKEEASGGLASETPDHTHESAAEAGLLDRFLERLEVWVADSAQNPALGTLPADSYVVNVRIHVTEAFNSDGTDNISVGWDADNDALATATDVSTVGVKVPTLGANEGYNSAQQAVEAYYVNGGIEPTTGKALVIVEFYRVTTEVA